MIWAHLRTVVPARAGILAIDDTGFSKHGTRSVAVQRQCCGALGKIGKARWRCRARDRRRAHVAVGVRPLRSRVVDHRARVSRLYSSSPGRTSSAPSSGACCFPGRAAEPRPFC
jgi:hypothetical protein